MEDLDAVILAKIDSDVDFQESLVVLSEEEQSEAINEKKKELLNQEFSSLREKAAKAEEAEKKFNDQKVRAEKAEEESRKNKPSEIKSELSTKDVLFLAKADIHEDNMDELIDWAKFKKIDVSEAYKQLKPKFDIDNEVRRTAEATNISPVRRGYEKVSDETLIENANAGKLPDDDAGIARLIEAKAKKR